MSIKTIANLIGISKHYAKHLALHHIDLNINPNEVLSILGPNGAGKTTLIKLLLGRLKPNNGQIKVFDQPAGSLAAKQHVGVMMQVANLPETLKVKEHIRLFQSYYAQPMAYQQVIEYAQLQGIENQLAGALSGGQKQRLLFAMAICGAPKLLILDEPSVGLDIEARRHMWQAITELKNQGTSVLLTTHYLEEADNLSDRIVMLNQGKIIAQGTVAQIKNQVASKVIRFTSNTSIDQLQDIEAVCQIKTQGKYYELQSSNPVNTLKGLFQKLNHIDDLTISGAALEDAFINLNAQAQSQA